ncbi:hypothetical protein KKP04_11170 [Rhodomicrobium sp. Az07]|uniref:hypothetical protein n=1 Tax=Rhodomicrobium sp. Az07 TaxID=2839034 RepID=UPI001BEB14F0|nr:hypothetical protein [Rhodomicrobium sp. Az07]MBT3071424.1 hypothetical protein [Rhodomicrobium sp. Az07]
MAQHGPTLSPDLIYVPYWQLKRHWEEERKKHEMRFLQSAAGRRFLQEQYEAREKKEWLARKKQRELQALRRARDEGVI